MLKDFEKKSEEVAGSTSKGNAQEWKKSERNCWRKSQRICWRKDLLNQYSKEFLKKFQRYFRKIFEVFAERIIDRILKEFPMVLTHQVNGTDESVFKNVSVNFQKRLKKFLMKILGKFTENLSKNYPKNIPTKEVFKKKKWNVWGFLLFLLLLLGLSTGISLEVCLGIPPVMHPENPPMI